MSKRRTSKSQAGASEAPNKTGPEQDVPSAEKLPPAEGEHGLSQSVQEQRIATLIRALNHSSPDVRRNAKRDLEEIGAAAVPALIAGLKHPYVVTRCQVATMLGRMREPGRKAVLALAEALRDPQSGVREDAAIALGELRVPDPEAVAELTSVLGDSQAGVRREAAAALGQMWEASAPAVADLSRALKDRDTEVRQNAAWALGRIGPQARDAVPGLVERLEDRQLVVRREAAFSLGQIGVGTPAAVRGLAERLKDREAVVRENATAALGLIGESARDAVPALAKALRDPQAGVRKNAAQALGRIGLSARQAIPALTEAHLHDEQSLVRLEAGWTLGWIGEVAGETGLVVVESLLTREGQLGESVTAALRRIWQQAGMNPLPQSADAGIPSVASAERSAASFKPLNPVLHDKVQRLFQREPTKAWYWLQTLAAVGQFGTYSAAAERLWKSNATAIRRSMETLEEELGVRIVDVTDNKGAYFTSEGQALYEWAEPMVRKLRQILAEQNPPIVT